MSDRFLPLFCPMESFFAPFLPHNYINHINDNDNDNERIVQRIVPRIVKEELHCDWEKWWNDTYKKRHPKECL